MRRLTGDEHLNPEFAATWPTYELDTKTRALLAYAAKLTDNPGAVDDADMEALRVAGWDERGIYEATALAGCSISRGGWRRRRDCRQTRFRPGRSSRKAGPTGRQTGAA